MRLAQPLASPTVVFTTVVPRSAGPRELFHFCHETVRHTQSSHDDASHQVRLINKQCTEYDDVFGTVATAEHATALRQSLLVELANEQPHFECQLNVSFVITVAFSNFASKFVQRSADFETMS